MKTEQEQIEQIEKVLKDSVADYKHLKKKGVCYCYAETLIDHGYGDISEYKAEIERLNSHNGFLQSVISHSKDMLDEAVKQAQIDTINTIVKYCENPNHWRELKDCKLFGGKSDDLRNFLNGIFKEVDV